MNWGRRKYPGKTLTPQRTATMANDTLVKRGRLPLKPKAGRVPASGLTIRIYLFLCFSHPLPRTSFSKRIQGLASSQKIPEKPRKTLSSLKRALLSFQRKLEAIDFKLVTDAMGGRGPPEEFLHWSSGYFATAAVGRSLDRYQFIRKVRMLVSLHQSVFDPPEQLGWATTSSVWLAL